jgi:chromosome partitioning protein
VPIYAVLNQKGGVGKSTTVANLSHALAMRGKKVLAVDFDHQSSLTDFLGVDPDVLEVTIHDLLFDRSLKAKDVIISNVRPNLDLLPSNMQLASAEMALFSRIAREYALKNCLEPVLHDYDYILIDCQPSLGLLAINAMAVADGVIAPVLCAYPSMRGLKQLMEAMEETRLNINPSLELSGVLITFYNKITRHSQEILVRLREFFGDKAFETVIPTTVRFQESPIDGKTIFEYMPTSAGASAYRELAEEVLQREKATTRSA